MPYTSSKNKLQEIYQKRGEPLPTYSSVLIDIDNGEKLFKATVTLACGRTFVGEPMKKKVHAEILAAAVALLHVTTAPAQLTSCACLFLDMENVPKAMNALLTEVVVPNTKIVGFHSMNTEYDVNSMPSNFEIVKVPTMHKDGADVGMLMYLGACLQKEQYTNIALVTKDHFACAAVDCVRAWSDKQITVCRDANSVIEWLKSLSTTP